jgi:integrase
MPDEGYALRRTKTNRRGIYYRDTPSGRRYEITYVDSDGRRRWQVVPGILRDAESALADVKDRQRKGERVAPTRATVTEIADSWFAAQTALRPNTRKVYKWAIENYIKPKFGTRRVTSITTDDVSDLIAEMQAAGRKTWSIRAVLTPLSGMLGHCARRGIIGSNPVKRLERGERPKVDAVEIRILNRDEIGRLLEHAAPELYRPMYATAIFSGLRLGELLGLVWGDVDFDHGVIRVRKQLQAGTARQRVELKTPHAIRDVMLIPALARTLKTHRLASPFSADTDFVFCTDLGTGLSRSRIARKGLVPAVKAANLDEPGRPKITPHQLRHCFASLLIAQGLNVVFVSRQMGHASPAVTLKVYAHLFDQAEHASKASAQLEAAFGGMLDGSEPSRPAAVVRAL